jgi:hypothetical protein
MSAAAAASPLPAEAAVPTPEAEAEAEAESETEVEAEAQAQAEGEVEPAQAEQAGRADRAVPVRAQRDRRGGRGGLLLLGITVLFVLSIYWAADSWSSVGQVGWLWRAAKCRVSLATVDRGRAGGAGAVAAAALWRTRFEVSFEVPTGMVSGNKERNLDGIVAWRYGSKDFNVSEAEARAYSGKFTVGAIYPCWLLRDAVDTGGEAVEGNEGWRVSMNPVAEKRSSNVDVALVSSFTVAIVLICFLVALGYAVRGIEEGAGGDTPGPTRTVQPNALSKAQISRICAVAAEAAARDAECGGGMLDGGAWDCAICLDDDGGDGGKLARLPCRHVFHLQCVRGWLMRGGVTCPLCNLRLQPVDEDAHAIAKSEALDSENDIAVSLRDEETGPLANLPDLAHAIMALTAAPEPASHATRGCTPRNSAESKESSSSSANDARSAEGNQTSEFWKDGGAATSGDCDRHGKADPDAFAALAAARRRHGSRDDIPSPPLYSASAEAVMHETMGSSGETNLNTNCANNSCRKLTFSPPTDASATADGSHEGDDSVEAGSSGRVEMFQWPNPDSQTNQSNKLKPY